MFVPRPLVFFPEKNVRKKIYPRPNVKNLIEEGVKIVSRRMLYTLCELNYTQTPSDVYWQKEAENKFGITKEQFDCVLKKYLKRSVEKVGEINSMGFYRISPDGHYWLFKSLRENNFLP